MPKLSRFGVIAKQTLIISAITFALTEVTFRIYGAINPTFIFYDNSYSRYRGRPNSPDYDSVLNSRGFKGKEFSATKPANNYRILAIGDSFTFGVVPSQYNYTARIERQLNRRLASTGRNYEVINMGIPGIGPKEYLAILNNEGLSFQPDMVVVFFFVGNDLLEAYQATGRRPWYSYSHVLSFINYALTVSQKYEGQIYHNATMKYDDKAPTLPEDKFLEIQLSRLPNFIKEDREFLESFRPQMEYIDQIKRICESRNIKLLVVIQPDEMQINQAQRSQLIKLDQLSEGQVDINQPNRLLSEHFTKQGIDYVDLLEPFRKSSENLYKPRDTHFNIAGNRVVAQVVTPRVIELINK